MIVRCEVKVWPSGDRHWMPLQLEDKGKVIKSLVGEPAIFLVMSDGSRKDLRKEPPFYQPIPCPYCGVEKDSNHEPSKHIDPLLGTPIEEFERTGEMRFRRLEQETNTVCIWKDPNWKPT